MTGRRLRALGVVVLAGLLAFGASPVVTRAAAPDPKVVLVVGPVGGLTETYRQWARAGAAEARRHTANVVEVYSPNATWPRVREAIQGASVVVYLGHGNGFPSPYGTKLRPTVQNGFGLNPVGGRGDGTHQYFGESVIADQVTLAKGALVLLFHLCYASGNSEPGVVEGDEATARQRVDNFAAGFLAAGASGVLADSYGSPAAYLKALLGGNRTIRAAFERSATANGNLRSFDSRRTRGAIAFMDPEHRSSGFTRSLVLAGGTVGAVPAGPVGGARLQPGTVDYVVPTLPAVAPDAFDLGARPGTPGLVGLPIAGGAVRLQLPVEIPSGVTLGRAYRLGVRWIPLDEPSLPAATSPTAPEATPLPGGSPSLLPAGSPLPATPLPGGSPSLLPAGSPAPASAAPPASPTADPAAPDDPTLVARESAASRIDVAEATVTDRSVVASVELPSVAGRYRLEVTIHDRDGVALGYPVQAAIPAVVVHVGGPGAAWLDTPPTMTVTAGTRASVRVTVTNGEAAAWGACVSGSRTFGPDDVTTCPVVRLVGRWVAIGGTGSADPLVRELTTPAAAAESTWLAGRVPATPGTYLLVASVERTTGDGDPEVLGRPVTITVTVEAEPLVPTPAGG